MLNTGSLTLAIAISRRFLRKGDFANGAVGTTLSFVLKLGDVDISSGIGSNRVEWERITKGAGSDPALAAADTAWNQNTGMHTLAVDVTASDLPSNFWTEREVQFRCTVDTGVIPLSRTITIH